MGLSKRKLALRRQAKEALAHINYMRKTYAGIKGYLESQIEEILPISLDSPKPQIKKLEELQTLQVNIMKAEEAFNDKFNPDNGEAVDYGALRDQIGRALDRLRNAERTVAVFKRSHQSTD